MVTSSNAVGRPAGNPPPPLLSPSNEDRYFAMVAVVQKSARRRHAAEGYPERPFATLVAIMSSDRGLPR
jgi:hypothetical protein